MPFIRVRAKDGPRHEFDAAQSEVEANPDLYEVLDKEPVMESRPPEYHPPRPRASTKSSVGETKKGDA